jgi:uncharacterized protein (TIGR04222 family)
MFPFDLPGPDFLFFYGLFAIGVIAAIYFLRRHYESGPPPSIDLKDPLLFACLRGGPKEVVSVAILGLIDRGLLKAAGRTIARSSEAKPELVEQADGEEVLSHFRQPAEIDAALKDASLLRVASEDYEEPLQRYQLVPDAHQLRVRFLLLIAALAALIGVGGAKLAIALSAGRSNIGFLILMMAVAVFIAIRIRGPHRTAMGESYLASIPQHVRRFARACVEHSAGKRLARVAVVDGLVRRGRGRLRPFRSCRSFAASRRRPRAGLRLILRQQRGGGCGGGGGGCGGCGS